jgi:hypothetical protein
LFFHEHLFSCWRTLRAFTPVATCTSGFWFIHNKSHYGIYSDLVQLQRKKKSPAPCRTDREPGGRYDDRKDGSVVAHYTFAFIAIFQFEQGQADPGRDPHAKSAECDHKMAAMINRFKMPGDFFLTLAAIHFFLFLRHKEYPFPDR